MARIKYIGKKAAKEDNIAGTKLVWAQGETLEIKDPVVAGKLLFHKDVWALDGEEPTDAMRVEMDKQERAYRIKLAEVPDLDDLDSTPLLELEETEEIDLDLEENDALPNITRMPRAQLARLAKAKFGKDFADDAPLDVIRNEIVSMQNSRKRVA